MKRLIILTTAICFTNCLQSQSIPRNVVSSAGKSSAVNNITLSSTVGETFTKTMSSANNSITQGFQQGKLIVARVANIITDETSNKRSMEMATAELSLNVFPNPTTDYVNIVAENETEQFDLTITDIQGKVVQLLKYNSQQVRIDFTQLNPGTYFIIATNENGSSKNTYKVIKQR